MREKRTSLARPRRAMAPVLREIRMLEKHDVIIGPRGGDGVPDTGQRIVLIRCVKRDLEYALLIGMPDAGVGQSRRQLIARLVIARRVLVEQKQRDYMWLRHAGGVAARHQGA